MNPVLNHNYIITGKEPDNKGNISLTTAQHTTDHKKWCDVYITILYTALVFIFKKRSFEICDV